MWRRQEQTKSSPPASEAVAGSALSVTAGNRPGPNTADEVEAPPSGSSSLRNPVQHAPAAASHLTSSLTIKGEVTGAEDLLIDAQLDGRIYLDRGTVTVGPDGRVTANIEADEIVVHGGVTGGLRGRDRVRISPTGRTTGDIVSHRIFIESGAQVGGRVEVTRPNESGAAPRAVAPTGDPVAVPRSVQSLQPLAKEPSAAA